MSISTIEYPGPPTGGASSSGPADVGDVVTDSNAATWYCTVAGSPGTWVGETTTPVATATTPTLANSATGTQIDTVHDTMLYLTVGTAGTAMVIKIGPTSTPANTVVSSSTATTGESYTIRVPAGWYVSWTATTATMANQLAVTC